MSSFSKDLLPGRAAEELLERVAGGARQRQARQATADARRPPAYGGPLGETVPAYDGEVSLLNVRRLGTMSVASCQALLSF